MILLVDLCYRENSLSRDEFVGPVARIISRTEKDWRVLHFSKVSKEEFQRFDGIILCGTALKDNVFSEEKEKFAWLLDVNVPVLGICAGMQALCMVYGGKIRPVTEIGMTAVRIVQPDPLIGDRQTFEAYELHSFACYPPDDWVVTSTSDSCVQSIHHPDRPLYGVMFHPEVRNDGVVERFCDLCK